MKHIKALLVNRLGLPGLVTLAQIFVFSALVVTAHALFLKNIPSLSSLLPILLAGGLISLQPSVVRGKIAVHRVIFMFAFGCAISFVMLLVFPASPWFYFLALLIGLVLVSVFHIKPFPLSAFIPMNLAYWMHPGEDMSPLFAVTLFLAISTGALLALVVVWCIHMSLKKNLTNLYRKYTALVEKREKAYTEADQTATNNLMLGLLTQIGLVQKGYVAEKKVEGEELALLKALYNSATQLYFTLQVMRDAPVQEHSAALFGRQFVAYRQNLQKLGEVRHGKV